MSLIEVSSRFFLELAVGLLVTVLWVDRPRIGAGFLRLIAGFVLLSLIPAFLLRPEEAAWTDLPMASACLFGGLTVLLLATAGRLPPRPTTGLAWLACLAGLGSVAAFVHVQLPEASAASLPLFVLAGVLSTLVLGLVTGAMILGHWYLVTPDLPVTYLGRVTAVSLWALYAKIAVLAVTLWWFADRVQDSAQGLLAAFGLGAAPVDASSFQDKLDFLYLLARILIGLVGPAVLCHMTLETVRLKATQPATGILYAATIMVLMGELFAFLGEASFGVVL